MIEILVAAGAGAFGGLVRAAVTGKGKVLLPTVKRVDGGSSHLTLGFLAPMLIGALAGLIAPWALHVDGIVAMMAGYAGTDFVENVIERRIGK